MCVTVVCLWRSSLSAVGDFEWHCTCIPDSRTHDRTSQWMGSSSADLRFTQGSLLPHNVVCTCTTCRLLAWLCINAMYIDVASYGALGHVPPSTSNCLIFLVTLLKKFRAAQTLNSAWLPSTQKNILAYSFITVYCVNFIIILWVILKLFSLIFVPLLSLNPGDATSYVLLCP